MQVMVVLVPFLDFFLPFLAYAVVEGEGTPFRFWGLVGSDARCSWLGVFFRGVLFDDIYGLLFDGKCGMLSAAAVHSAYWTRVEMAMFVVICRFLAE